jgi:hypothetical protein
MQTLLGPTHRNYRISSGKNSRPRTGSLRRFKTHGEKSVRRGYPGIATREFQTQTLPSRSLWSPNRHRIDLIGQSESRGYHALGGERPAQVDQGRQDPAGGQE